MTAQAQQRSARFAADAAELTVQELWLHYFSIGGNVRAFELDAYLNGVYPLPVGDRNLVALALNELIDDLPQRPRAVFDDDVVSP
ncbi:hypothetical protein [Arthrobacter sp. SX1312]|uniref:hypothetical protein n=1 Tax=Arthrobacter sp. SX1312 TaxID=2058896 RepID=UPI000CE451FE|nr:hypothetical protein [Arthrobacter sp. SX1312]